MESTSTPGLRPPGSGDRRLIGDRFQYWQVILIFLALLVLFFVFRTDQYITYIQFLLKGVKYTVIVSVSAYSLALVFGLITGLARVSKNPVVYTISSLYVEVIRGVPVLVNLLYMAFVISPAFTKLFGLPRIDLLYRGIAGLAIAYGAFEAEVIRAGIQSVSKGQMEAAQAVGMSYFQAMRLVILPQAIRNVLPPLGNDFIAMLKDSSLVSVLAISDLTHQGRLLQARTFRTFEVFTLMALLYLGMTLMLSTGVRFLEKRVSSGRDVGSGN